MGLREGTLEDLQANGAIVTATTRRLYPCRDEAADTMTLTSANDSHDRHS
jgi:hypothetical protein